MGENTKIEWCEHSWSPWRGCTKVSPGCAHCYAETLSKRNPAVLGQWGNGKPRVLAKNWGDPVKWNRKRDHDLTLADPMGMNLRPVTVFPSLCDWLDDEVPVEWLAKFLQLIHDTPNLKWLLLTKRPENFRRLVDGQVLAMLEMRKDPAEAELREWLRRWINREPPANVWIGTSVEDQTRADERIPEILRIPAVGRFLSVEPLLGPVELPLAGNTTGFPKHIRRDGSGVGMPQRINWVIIGGESGHGSRPCNVEWIQSLVRQCKDASVPAFVKQLGAVPCFQDRKEVDVSDWPDHVEFAQACIGLHVKLRHAKGGDPAEWPEDLRVREFPEGLR